MKRHTPLISDDAGLRKKLADAMHKAAARSTNGDKPLFGIGNKLYSKNRLADEVAKGTKLGKDYFQSFAQSAIEQAIEETAHPKSPAP